MTEQNIRYSTSHLHELVAEIERRVFDGFRVDNRSAFAARRQGSAYVVWFVPTRESLDFDDILDNPPPPNEKLRKLLEESKEAFKDIVEGQENQQLTIQEKWQVDDLITEMQEMQKYKADNPDKPFSGVVEIENKEGESVRLPGIVGYKTINGTLIDIDEDIKEGKVEPLPKELLDRMEDLRNKAEANREKDNGIFDRLVQSIKSAQENPESCVSNVVEVDKDQVKVYSKEELDAMHWNELKPILDEAGIRGRRRANLIRDFLKWQEES